MHADVYVFGMTVLSTIHLLDGEYPPANGYREIKQTFVMPGGEAANCAIVLQSFGYGVRLDGCLLGEQTRIAVPEFLSDKGVDVSLMKPTHEFSGWRDTVLCDGKTRTVFGTFVRDLFSGRQLWTEPDEASIRSARCVAIDPFFGGQSQQAARLCRKHGVDYVTIDCRFDDPIAREARAVVISREFLDREFPNADRRRLLEEFRRSCRGLVIFTFGAEPSWCTSPEVVFDQVSPYPVTVVDSLAAGDSFRAGLIAGMLQGESDRTCIEMASATAGVVCTRFPSVLQPPTLDEVRALMRSSR